MTNKALKPYIGAPETLEMASNAGNRLKTVSPPKIGMRFPSQNRRPLIALLIVVAFLVFVSVFVKLNEVPSGQPHVSPDGGPCVYEQKLNFIETILPLLASLGIMVGALTYYFVYQKVEHTAQSLKANTDILLQFLNKEERAIVDLLIKENGKVLQSELTRLPGMGKVRAHRIVQRLIDRRVIETEEHGKTNLVRFTKEIKAGLL